MNEEELKQLKKQFRAENQNTSVFYIDVGDMPRAEAEQHIHNIMSKYVHNNKE